jgi:hypothetical protein
MWIFSRFESLLACNIAQVFGFSKENVSAIGMFGNNSLPSTHIHYGKLFCPGNQPQAAVYASTCDPLVILSHTIVRGAVEESIYKAELLSAQGLIEGK